MKPQRFIVASLALPVFVLAFAGCATATYQTNLPGGPAKPDDYPVSIYTPEMKIPRPCEIIGTVSIRAGHFTMFGGSMDTELKQVLQYAHAKGADAVQLDAIEKPDFTNPNYQLAARLLRYTDVWEKIAVTKGEFLAYLAANRRKLDPIEGVWTANGADSHTIGIVQNHSRPGRDFAGFVLDEKNPAWPEGFKKMDIRHGLERGSYVLTYYSEDFTPNEIPIVLGRKQSFTLAIQKADDDNDFIIYTKN